MYIGLYKTPNKALSCLVLSFLRKQEAGGGGGGRRHHNHLGTLITPAVLYGYIYPVLDTHTSSYRKLSYAGPSQYELRQEYSFLLFSKAFIVTLLLCRVLYTINFTILSFSVFVIVSLKKYCYFHLSLIPTQPLESNLFYHNYPNRKNVSSMFQPEVN